MQRTRGRRPARLEGLQDVPLWNGGQPHPNNIHNIIFCNMLHIKMKRPPALIGPEASQMSSQNRIFASYSAPQTKSPTWVVE